MNQIRLGPGGEFDLIRGILRDASAARPPVALAAGDDCALIDGAEAQLALSVDLTVEGVHFLAEWGSYEQAGRRAVLAAISDLAAMGAEPLAVLLAVGLPEAVNPEVAEGIGRSCRAAAEEMGAALIGGDVSRGGPGLVLDVAVVGEVSAPLLRGNVRPGDDLFVTGHLGAAAAAVAEWKAAREPKEEWAERFWNPRPRVREARWLEERGVTAAIDLSDGLIADAGHLAAASGVSIELDVSDVPVVAGVDRILALTGGEDYELLVGVPSGILDPAKTNEFESRFQVTLTRVGRATSGSGVRVFKDGEEVKVTEGGFDHFRIEAER